MTFLPIVRRELGVASRRRSTYWVRTLAALAVLAIGTWVFLMDQSSKAPKDLSVELFCVLTGSAVLYSLTGGVRLTSDCLSEEKREGTLGLLFLTDLKGYDVVLGKLAATSVNALYSLLAMVPMLAIPLLMGGITPGEWGRMALVAANTLFLSLALGIGISAVSRSALKAMVATLVLLLLLTVLMPAGGAILEAMGKTRTVKPGFLYPSVGFGYYLAFAGTYATPNAAAEFWYSMLTVHGLGWLFLVLASIAAPRTWQDRPPGSKIVLWRELWQQWSLGNLAQRIAFRRRLLSKNAFFWLAARVRLKPAFVWAFLGVICCGWLWGLVKFHREWLSTFTCMTTAIFLNLVLRAWVAVEASRQMAAERKAGTLELLLSTPLTVREILRGQLQALQRQFLGPVVAVLAAESVFMGVTLSEAQGPDDRAQALAIWIAIMLMLVADLGALYWVGMWQGLRARNPGRAATGSLWRILVVPWLVIALIALFQLLRDLIGAHVPDPGWQFMLGVWFMVGLATDLIFGLVSRYKLVTEFRLTAQQRFTSPIGFWKRLFRGPETDSLPAPPTTAEAR
jgi:ABC-type transport system involved in multi-copper enzyme maturation permease subunit